MTAFIYDLLYTVPAGVAATALCRNFTGREGILPMVVAAALELIFKRKSDPCRHDCGRNIGIVYHR